MEIATEREGKKETATEREGKKETDTEGKAREREQTPKDEITSGSRSLALAHILEI
jgi:hypothetical protein